MTLVKKPAIIRVVGDSDSESPRSWDNLGTIAVPKGSSLSHLGDAGVDIYDIFPDRATILAYIRANGIEDDIVDMALEYQSWDAGDIRGYAKEYFKDCVSDGEIKADLIADLIDSISIDEIYETRYSWILGLIESRCLILPVYAYQHGNIALNTTGFSCQWDSGQCGIIFAKHDAIRENFGIKPGEPIPDDKMDTASKCLVGEIETLSQWANGGVYGFQIEDADGERLDSCYGFFGYDPKTNGMQDHIPAELWDYLDQAFESIGDDIEIECGHEPADRITPPIGSPLPTCKHCGTVYMPDDDDE